METRTAVLLTVVAGGVIALQSPVNGALGDRTGPLPAAALSFLIGTVVLFAIVAVRGELGRLGDAVGVPWWGLTGGLLGAAYVTVALSTVGRLGVGGVVAATIAGELALSVLVDRFGLLGVEPRALTTGRVLGIGLLAAGVYLVVRD